DSIRTNPWIEAADADAISFPLHVRTRRPGDRFVPLGLSQTMKLKDFLINESAPYYDRDRIPLLSDRQGIIWVAGMRLSDTVKLTDQTQRVLVMRMKGV
ncbi:tRNA lysidine(34) synthetase TilS, partial [Candidatus Bipolaricaulota bacterium]|nr:tRNA lysidine(34) synthetase TilS [Candidatus Bipolaricaulota bacterium]